MQQCQYSPGCLNAEGSCCPVISRPLLTLTPLLTQPRRAKAPFQWKEQDRAGRKCLTPFWPHAYTDFLFAVDEHLYFSATSLIAQTGRWGRFNSVGIVRIYQQESWESNWRHGSSYRAPVLQVWSPEFKPQFHKERERKRDGSPWCGRHMSLWTQRESGCL
jgi:hypothetical protein